MTERDKLVKEPVTILMVRLCTPAIIGMVVIGLYTFMDGIFAGQMIGSNAMGAISVAYPITLLNNGIATLVGIGSASVLSRAIGGKNQNLVDKIMGNLVAFILVLSSILMVLGIVFARNWLMITGADGEILNLGVRYLRIIFIGSIFVNFTQSANMVMRGEGLMKKAMMIMGFGAILNIILDPIFIILFGERAIEGLATATVTSQVVQSLITLYYFLKKSPVVKINKIQFEKDVSSEMFSVGVSAMMMQVLTIIQQTLLYRAAFTYGGNAQAVLMGAALRIQAFSFIPLWGMSQGLQPVVGTNYGAGNHSRVKKATNVFMAGATLLALLFWVPIEIFPDFFLRLFIKDLNLVTGGIFHFRIFYSVFLLYGVMIMIITFFQSIGSGKLAGILVFSRQIFFFIPFILLLPKWFGISAVWLTAPLVDFIIVLLAIVFVIFTYRKLGEIQKIEKKEASFLKP